MKALGNEVDVQCSDVDPMWKSGCLQVFRCCSQEMCSSYTYIRSGYVAMGGALSLPLFVVFIVMFERRKIMARES